jgi:hypothetical protein
MAVMLSALRAGRHLPARRFLVIISVRGWVDPRVIVQLDGLGRLKNTQWPHRESNPRPSDLCLNGNKPMSLLNDDDDENNSKNFLVFPSNKVSAIIHMRLHFLFCHLYLLSLFHEITMLSAINFWMPEPIFRKHDTWAHLKRIHMQQ